MKWEKVRLGNIVNITTGKLDANANIPLGQYPFFTCAVEPLRINKYSYDCECVLIAGNGDLNVKYYSGKFDAYQRTYIIESKNTEILNTKYLYYFLNNYIEKLRDLSIGGVIKYIKLNNLTDPIIPLPPLSIQLKISSILDHANNVRNLNNQLLKKYDELVQNIFTEMFGDEETITKLTNKPLSSVSEVVSGVTKGRKFNGKATVEVPYMRVANVQDGHIDLTEIKTIEVLPDDVEKFRLKFGDILLTEGGDPDKLGRGAVWKFEVDDCIHQNHIFRVRVNQEILNWDYLSALLGSKYGKKYFLKAAKQTTGIASINSTQLKAFPVPIPPIDLQNSYSKVLEKLVKQKEYTKINCEKGENLFQSLIKLMFEREKSIN